MTSYNKDEVISEYKKRFGLCGHTGKCNCRKELLFISTALEAAYAAGKAERKVEHCAEPECPECNIVAYKAGRESMYQAGGKACKKVYQNHKEDHLCRFNDGEQNCNCYLSGINEVIVALEALK